ncbi:hypothetical protein SAMN05444422_104105 [Halobiforma haloterrestris]|uniref:HEAT repeat-containing protein n=1 Tax=Natronobacterium haloterrestre TaxID=148448 RepID=A0A1I1G613_NATHA|nr:hypothetical protein [Halobiforma haloterrestris]SFC06772.1 hypothetical protein SAMN05444422_104105 [Halobiforma haloterrestris]
MDGEGGNAVGQHRDSEAGEDAGSGAGGDSSVGSSADVSSGASEFDLPSVLARLDDPTPATRREAVDRIRDAIDHEERPERCLPAVPKLRTLLEESTAEIDYHDEVAYCLAELAAESPTDVAPSTDAIAGFVDDHDSHAATPDLLRCLAAVAAERPAAVGDHLETLAVGLDHESPAARADAATALSRVVEGASDDDVAGIEAGDIDATLPWGRVLESLEDDPASVRENACRVIGFATELEIELEVDAVRDRLAALADGDSVPAVRERAEWALERLP